MSYWDYSQIGFSCEKNGDRVHELLECFGIDFNDYQSSKAGYIGDFYPDDVGGYKSDLSVKEIYYIVNKVYSDTTIYYESETGSDTNDSYRRYEEIYNPKDQIVYIGELDYCYDGDKVFGESVFDILRDECEAEAMEKGIPIEWGGDYPEGEEFSDLCYEILEEHGGIYGMGERTDTKSLEDLKIEIESEKLKSIIDNAAKNGYNDLVEDITKAFEMDYVSPFVQKQEKKNKKKTKKPSRDQLAVAKEIDKLNLELESTSLADVFWTYDQDAIDSLNEDDLIELAYYTETPDAPDEYVVLYHDGIKIASFECCANSDYVPAGVQGVGGLVYTWAYIKKKEDGDLFLKYEYRFLNLEYEAIRKEILDLIGDKEKIPVLDIYRTKNNNDNEEISVLWPGGNFVSKDSVLKERDEFKYIDRGFENHIIKNARYLGIDYLKYDLNSGYTPNYVEIFENLLKYIGNRIEVVAFAGLHDGSIDISNINVGDTLQLFLVHDKKFNEIEVKKEGDIVGYLGWKAVNHISYIMEKAKIDSIAEVIEIIPRADITNQGEVFVKIVLTE